MLLAAVGAAAIASRHYVCVCDDGFCIDVLNQNRERLYTVCLPLYWLARLSVSQSLRPKECLCVFRWCQRIEIEAKLQLQRTHTDTHTQTHSIAPSREQPPTMCV